MYEKTLEIRGINRSELISYLIAIGAKETDEQVNDNHRLFIGDNWSSTVSEEETFKMFQSNIPKVYVTFSSNDEARLTEIIKLFRKKTFRAGG